MILTTRGFKKAELTDNADLTVFINDNMDNLEIELNKTTSGVNRLTVGTNGQYTTIKAAVDWFNASATSNIEILLAAEHHLVTDTITVNNPSRNLFIRGLGSSVSFIDAHTGLTGKPMFNFKSYCDISKCQAVGSTLTNYGTATNENFITFNTNSNIYSEITDIQINGFKIGVADLIGVDIFLFNYIISDCGEAVRVDYSSTGIALTTLDMEVGNIINCPIGVYLKKALLSDFLIMHVIFKHTNSGDIAMLYDGNNFNFNGIGNIFNCTYNNLGTFMSGFDFSRADGRDADIEVIGNAGSEDMVPHSKINIIDNTATTTITTGNTYYNLNGIIPEWTIDFDVAATAGTFTITYNGQTTSNIAYNATVATIKSALEALTNITTVTVIQITASKAWNIDFNTVGEGWHSTMSVNISGLSTTTSVIVASNYYTKKLLLDHNKITFLSNHVRDMQLWITGNVSCDNDNRNVNIGAKKNGTGRIISPFTIRTGTRNQAYPFAMAIYISDMIKNDFIELFITSTNNGDVVRLWDLNFLTLSR